MADDRGVSIEAHEYKQKLPTVADKLGLAEAEQTRQLKVLNQDGTGWNPVGMPKGTAFVIERANVMIGTVFERVDEKDKSVTRAIVVDPAEIKTRGADQAIYVRTITVDEFKGLPLGHARLLIKEEDFKSADEVVALYLPKK